MNEHDKQQNGASRSESAADSTAAFEQAAAAPCDETYVLTIYVAGMRARSQRAIEGVRRLCEEHLADRYELNVIDIYQQPSLAIDAQIVATPTLVKKLPPPLRRIIGDMSDDGRVLVALGLKAPPPQPPSPDTPRDSP